LHDLELIVFSVPEPSCETVDDSDAF